jgi:hypothetical protein
MPLRMKQNWDLIFGTGGLFAGFSVSQVNAWAGLFVTLSVLFIMVIRARKEWLSRNDKPPKDQ